MGQKSSTETVAAVLQAFLEKRRLVQSDLADHVGVRVPALRSRLEELRSHELPLTRIDDHPWVYWSVPDDWFPGGVAFAADDSLELLRQIGRLPRSKTRDRFIERILKAAPQQGALAGDPMSPLVAPSVSERMPREGVAHDGILMNDHDRQVK
jgi:hypothetical protein